MTLPLESLSSTVEPITQCSECRCISFPETKRDGYVKAACGAYLNQVPVPWLPQEDGYCPPPRWCPLLPKGTTASTPSLTQRRDHLSSIAAVQWGEIPSRFGFVACDQKYMWRAFSYKPFFFEGEWKFDVASNLLDTGREEMKLTLDQVKMYVSPSTLDFSQTLHEREPSRPYHLTSKHAVDLMSKGGEWLGAARNGLQCKAVNGSDVTWGSNELIRGLSVADFELIAASIAAAAQNELLSKMKFGSQPAFLVMLGQAKLCPHTVQDWVELFGLSARIVIEGNDGAKRPLSMKDLDFSRGELCFKRKSP